MGGRTAISVPTILSPAAPNHRKKLLFMGIVVSVLSYQDCLVLLQNCCSFVKKKEKEKKLLFMDHQKKKPPNSTPPKVAERTPCSHKGVLC